MPLSQVETFPFRWPFGLLRICALILPCFYLTSCGSNTCDISTSISPETATADHKAASAGNRAQFSLSSHVSGVCQQTPDFVGTWSTSDPVDTTIQADPTSNAGIATCVNATPNPATISNSGKIRGKPFPTATLTCH